VFGVPAGKLGSFLKELDPAQHHGVRHEAAAVWMATAIYHATGEVAVAYGEAGPGSHNLIGGLGTAYANGLALLVVTTSVPAGMAMHVDPSLVDGCVKARLRLEPGRVGEIVAEALELATADRPGPVYLEFPVDAVAPAIVRGPMPRSFERPLVIAGGGVARSGTAGEVRELVERLGAAATCTQMGIGCIPSDHPQFIGHGGVIGGPAVIRALEEADVVISIGCRWSSWLWDGDRPAARGPIVDLDAVHEMGTDPLPCTPAAGWVDGLVAEHRAYLESLGDDDDPMHPAVLAREIGRALPADALVVYDGVHTSFWSNDLTPVAEPNTRFHDPGMGHLGFGIPYANGLKLRFPDRPVVNITGDGAFGFTVAELDTARRLGLNAVHVIHDNEAWGVIRLGQSKAGFELGTDLSGTDYVAIARAFGCHAERVEKPDEVAPALQRAFESGLPAVIDARVRLVPHPGLPRFARAGMPSR
jgi:acetolactate synthase-1/2/3 large subunit